MKKILITTLLSICCLTAAIAQSNEVISQEQALQIAEQALRDYGVDESHFGGETSAKFHEQDNAWYVFSQQKPSEEGLVMAGGHMTVKISADGQDTEIYPGV